MKFQDQQLLEEAYDFIQEKLSVGKSFVQQGSLSQEDFDQIVNADPTKQKKYVGWLASQWVKGQVSDPNVLRNTIEEFDVFANRGKVKNKDIYQYKTFNDLKSEVDRLNDSGEAISSKDLESDFEVIRDDENLLIMSPHTHEASRKLGLSHFAFRECEGGKKDSAWCTTYKAPNHFNDYYYKHSVTFYYVKVRSEELLQKLKKADFGPEFSVVAIAVIDSETTKKAKRKGYADMDAYDGKDEQFSGNDLKQYLEIIGLK